MTPGRSSPAGPNRKSFMRAFPIMNGFIGCRVMRERPHFRSGGVGAGPQGHYVGCKVPAAARVSDHNENGAASRMGNRLRKSTYVLVVDDDPDVLGALLEALQMEGYEVQGARDGIDALHAIDKRRPDLIITDLLMPTMTGFELL